MGKLTSVDVHFIATETNYMTIPDVLFKSIPLKADGLKFMHLEKKGNQWILLHTDGFVVDNEMPVEASIVFVRQETRQTPYRPNMLINDRPHPVTRYTAISTINKSEFYHLDELDDHTYRITHGVSFFGGAQWMTPHERTKAHHCIQHILIERKL